MPESRTAEFVAFYRALETSEPGRAPLFRDPLAESFLRPGLRAALRAAHLRPLRAAIVRYADWRAPGARSSAIGRTRFIDDVVERAAAGATQLVLLGAGYDCRPYRLPGLRSVRVFEVDQPEMLALRRARLVGKPPLARDVSGVPIDFTRDDLRARLVDAGFDEQAPTIFVWEGVTNYLPEPAVADVLRFIGGCGGGGTLVFTYVHRGVIDGTLRFEGAEKVLRNVQRLGEPWKFGLVPGETREYLRRFGIDLTEDAGADEYRGRYLGTATNELRGYAFYRVAVGALGGPLLTAGSDTPRAVSPGTSGTPPGRPR
jgi:methyltransferase (TIGR00027 family)